MFAAFLCVVPPAIGWLENGYWGFSGFTIGGMLDSLSLTKRLGPLQPILNPFLPLNPGWLLFLLGLICLIAALSRED